MDTLFIRLGKYLINFYDMQMVEMDETNNRILLTFGNDSIETLHMRDREEFTDCRKKIFDLDVNKTCPDVKNNNSMIKDLDSKLNEDIEVRKFTVDATQLTKTQTDFNEYCDCVSMENLTLAKCLIQTNRMSVENYTKLLKLFNSAKIIIPAQKDYLNIKKSFEIEHQPYHFSQLQTIYKKISPLASDIMMINITISEEYITLLTPIIEQLVKDNTANITQLLYSCL